MIKTRTYQPQNLLYSLDPREDRNERFGIAQAITTLSKTKTINANYWKRVEQIAEQMAPKMKLTDENRQRKINNLNKKLANIKLQEATQKQTLLQKKEVFNKKKQGEINAQTRVITQKRDELQKAEKKLENIKKEISNQAESLAKMEVDLNKNFNKLSNAKKKLKRGNPLTEEEIRLLDLAFDKEFNTRKRWIEKSKLIMGNPTELNNSMRFGFSNKAKNKRRKFARRMFLLPQYETRRKSAIESQSFLNKFTKEHLNKKLASRRIPSAQGKNILPVQLYENTGDLKKLKKIAVELRKGRLERKMNITPNKKPSKNKKPNKKPNNSNMSNNYTLQYNSVFA